ncbi:MAG: type I-C CRISPR-associated protein Cas8c/Csd1 [Geminicoccaceae bacterium]|nr:type I-C CRISPR-associated protein Cas8c/Csd1 [Geminicoccaceae bacterium]
MSVLASLVRAYERMPDAPPFGYSSERIGVVISLNEDGSVAHVIDWRETEGKKRVGRMMEVPQPVKRTAGIAANFLWDKTSYALGLTAGSGKRLAAEHAAFVALHDEVLANSGDTGLSALLAFLHKDHSHVTACPGWNDELMDLNVAFCLETERRQNILLYDRMAAREIWQHVGEQETGESVACLVTGRSAFPSRLHPSIKGVWGAQSSGAAIVSFNLDAFTSYGHEQGANAPVSPHAAFAYTTALNRFLATGSGHRLQIGDTSIVFWADAEDAEIASLAEAMASGMLEPGEEAGFVADERDKVSASSTQTVGNQLERLRKGVPLAEIEPRLTTGVRFFVLGLAPNAARLSVRFYFEDTFGAFAENYRRFCADMRIEPPPRGEIVPLWRYVLETASMGKKDNVLRNLAGEWLRAVLAGTDYPYSMLGAVLLRIRADKGVNALRAAILKAVLVRNRQMEVPVALDPDQRNKGYVLGRLFAVYEEIQREALGRNVNATIKDKFYGSASATPRKVFAMLEAGSANHLAKIGKMNMGRRVNLEKKVGAIMDLMEAADDPFPASFSAEQQALFGLGYYHENSARFSKHSSPANSSDSIEEGADQ